MVIQFVVNYLFCFVFFLGSTSDVITPAESSPRSLGQSGEDWKSAFASAANGSIDRSSLQHETRSRSADSRGRRYENGDANLGSRRTPNRLPPTPPQSGGRY
jgi:dynamin 1/3